MKVKGEGQDLFEDIILHSACTYWTNTQDTWSLDPDLNTAPSKLEAGVRLAIGYAKRWSISTSTLCSHSIHCM